MDPLRNPFAPGAGSRPPELAGRDDVLEKARIACGRAVRGRSVRSLMLLGLRGTGKTVLLNEIKKIGESEGLIATKIESPENTRLAKLLVPEMMRALRILSAHENAKDMALRGLRAVRSFVSVFKVEFAGMSLGVEPEVGLADSGNIEADLTDLFRTLGLAAQAAGKGWLLLIDEVQYLAEEDLSAIIVAIHHMSQENLPVVFVGAGLPQVARLAGDAKSYAERLFDYPKIGALASPDAVRAVTAPIVEEGESISGAAVNHMVELTQGYPFFIQEWASIAWNITEDGASIELKDAENAYTRALESLDEGFFKVRYDRLTKAEIKFVAAMSELGEGPYQMGDIASKLGTKVQSLGPARASIIHKGMIYSTDHGYLDFTVPLFADHMRRAKIDD
nr:ATP-binding protein [uncultured Gellertiella sp.]